MLRNWNWNSKFPKHFEAKRQPKAPKSKYLKSSHQILKKKQLLFLHLRTTPGPQHSRATKRQASKARTESFLVPSCKSSAEDPADGRIPQDPGTKAPATMRGPPRANVRPAREMEAITRGMRAKGGRGAGVRALREGRAVLAKRGWATVFCQLPALGRDIKFVATIGQQGSVTIFTWEENACVIVGWDRIPTLAMTWG